MKYLARVFLAMLALGTAPAAAQRAGAPPMFNWTGCYIGANVGGGWSYDRYTDPLALPGDPFFLGNHTASGVVGGGQVGCDIQWGNFVLGARGMFDGADLTGDHLFAPAGDIFRTHIPWFATATARAGYAFQPNFLIYIVGGGAWKRQEEQVIDFPGGFVEALAESSRSGGVVGGGFEWQFWSNWSFFAEYNYMSFGTRRLTYTALPELGEVGIPAPFPLDIREHVSVVMVGVNLHLGGWR